MFLMEFYLMKVKVDVIDVIDVIDFFFFFFGRMYFSVVEKR